MSLALKTHLFSRYGSFADKRIKKIEKGGSFIGDSRANGGIASDGSLYGWFCGILVDVESDEEVRVTLFGSVPTSPLVDSKITLLGGVPGEDRIVFRVRKENLVELNSLAVEIAAIVAPGRRYSTAGYKYMCPITATSLRKLAEYLKEFWT